MSGELRELVNTLREFENGMLVTHNEARPPRARPMQIAEVEDDGSIWFLSKPDTRTVDALDHDRNVAVVCQRPDTFAYVGGVAEVYQFASKLRTIWKPSFNRWFPKGPEASDAVAIRVSPVEGDLWNAEGEQVSFRAG